LFPYRNEDLRDTPLGTDRAAFSCGQADLDEYFCRHHIDDDVKRGVTRAYVLTNTTGGLIGYYTLSNYAIARTLLSSSLERKVGYEVVPAILLGRLAIQTPLHKQGVGRLLLFRAQVRAVDASRQCAARVLIVDTVDDHARNFYKRNDFQKLKGDSEQYFLDLKWIEKRLGAAAQ